MPPGLLSQIWNEAETILSYHSFIHVDGGVYCMTEPAGRVAPMFPLVERRFCANVENLLVQQVFALMR